ncbi:hypothetical protein P344_02810 [Spiroplasma mirum ATCC 29335]|uniref:Uncharacterized protein n=1 Tax=Spiroplasma mirum ATCC 29335 TaxID=838561 RepID=W6AL57_9MOLU|nr:hypothetical protein P344_02810 [Spiroplasma mirum ATCC 29335]
MLEEANRNKFFKKNKANNLNIELFPTDLLTINLSPIIGVLKSLKSNMPVKNKKKIFSLLNKIWLKINELKFLNTNYTVKHYNFI